MSLDSNDEADESTTKKQPPQTSAVVPRNAYKPPSPSLSLLFSLFSKKDLLALVLPATVAALAAATIPPFMTLVIGDAYDVFSKYQSTLTPNAQDNAALLTGIGLAALEFAAMGVGALFLSAVMSALWMWVGERNVMYLRRLVYDSVAGREMEWYDRNTDESTGAVGAGGLMSQFASATEDVRIATALNMGMMLQHGCTILATIILAFIRSPALAGVILSTIPVAVVVQGVAQTFGSTFYQRQSREVDSTSTTIDRTLTAISTVKAFNAQSLESARTNFKLELVRLASNKLTMIWSIAIGFANFVTFSMFVQGFWFGAKLVREGKISSGDVLAVFWACLIAASTLNSFMACAVAFTKGKSSMVTLMTLIHSPLPSSSAPTDGDEDGARMSLQPIRTPNKATFFPAGKGYIKQTPLRKIRPATCNGEFTLTNITFAYPSRPTVPVLSNVTIFLPSSEMTFIVGGSGSGKSTLAQLLLRLYDPQQGTMELDGQSMAHLDVEWVRGEVGCVSQQVVMFDGSVHDNVALGVAGGRAGRHPRDVTREQVIAACRVALLHDFVRELPDGYDTRLGNGGASLSGGQKQRLAIARAYMRDPTVLILDEATSALDATSRLLVFEAIKHWRKKRTTIVITHDLSQITSDDFVYLLKNGVLVEQGFRADLEADPHGEFSKMGASQNLTGGFVPQQDIGTAADRQRDEWIEEAERDREERNHVERKHFSALAVNPTLPAPGAQVWLEDVATTARSPSRLGSDLNHGQQPMQQGSRPRRRSLVVEIPDAGMIQRRREEAWRRSSLQLTPTTTTDSSFVELYEDEDGVIEDDAEFEDEKNAMQLTAVDAQRRRVKSTRRRWDVPQENNGSPSKEHKKLKRSRSRGGHVKSKSKSRAPPLPSYVDNNVAISSPVADDKPQITFWQLIRIYWPTIPNKFVYVLGLFSAILAGICTPIFGFFLSQLVIAITTSREAGAHDEATVTKYGLIVLGLAIGNGFAYGVKFYLIEWAGNSWLASVRKRGFERMVWQDKAWFDQPNNVPSQLLLLLIRDPDDAKSFLTIVMPQIIVVTSMLGTGIVWALIRGWQLTLVGFALVPLFVALSTAQNRFSGKYEARNKERREEVNRKYYDAVANVRAIRAMGFERVFKEQFERALERAMRCGVDGGFVDGMAFGIANAVIYLAQGLIYYVGAVFIVQGIYSFLQMIEVLNLVAFSLVIAAQTLYFTQKIHKSLQALRDFERILNLRTNNTSESRGSNKWPLEGPIRFHDVAFAYPTRPEANVLRNLSLRVEANECVAIVGASGSGKSTVAALLQRLYEPASGAITINGHKLHHADVVALREQIAVVSQTPQLFDASIGDNIGYGGSGIFPQEEIERAAKEANIHDFIMSLPDGYDTMVGENASLISGGQAQRISIARALVRPANLLILDECTSALDSENQREVMKTIQSAKVGRTTVIVTHKLPIMQMADRIIVIEDGGVAEEGPYADLMKRRGTFHKLATAGEWEGAD
ncbi:hypothetical protein M408DRAFT_27162 [Serendipita vermifera MAFF 305830]|uniref:Uncharacterized protein n=1 Tax=Serendipita vermifera MAFF 305830 TaxID=933852 RepID=A0A0C2WCZ7_SERVB|nr:hypothetical protein M408DRAFT_27162 [Serendipita vermifera MAFF 305830]